MPQNTPAKVFTAALAFALDAGAEGYPEGYNAHVLPDGLFRAEDGRPASQTGGELRDWLMNAEVAANLVAALERSGKPILYDYEHNSRRGDSRAAGWIDRLTYVPGRGLFAHVDWTSAGARDVDGKVYRYSSPFFAFDPKTGAVTRLLSVALTNDPALGELGAVDLARKHFGFSSTEQEQEAAMSKLGDRLRRLMDEKGVTAEQLGNAAGIEPGTVQQILRGDIDRPPDERLRGFARVLGVTFESLRDLLGDAALSRKSFSTTEEEADMAYAGEVAALTAERNTLKTSLAALTAERDGLKAKLDAVEAAAATAALAAEKTKHAELLQAALTDGRLVPAQKPWAEKQPLAALTEYLDATAPLSVAQRQAAGAGAGTGGHGLSADELAMCTRMGVSPEEFAKTKAGGA